MINIKISTEYIKLGQFIKFVHLIDSGGQEKIFLLSHSIYVNNEKDNRRGRKLYPNDIVRIDNDEYKIEC